ncbi:MAG TPA: hypothetical protein VLZ50_08930 [Terracidiphilus sp.]|nr:hypothetical protein [Terracidiphilus sp.]
MRASLIAFLCFLTFALTSCNIGDHSDRRDDRARHAGREAYQASRDLKKDAKEAARELRNASKEFREGWSQAQQEDARRPKAEHDDADRYDSNQTRQSPRHPKPNN